MSSPASTNSPLRRHEWDFSSVPDRELEACLLWESSREWPDFRSDVYNWGKPDHEHEPTLVSLEEETNLQNALELKQILIGPFEGDFDAAWQDASPAKREEATEIANPGLAPIPPGLFHMYQMSGEPLVPGQDGIAVFRVNWHQTDNRLLADLDAWLKANRKYKPRENRGNNPRDHLKMFGAMRLLHHHTYEDAFALTERVLGKPLYGVRASWDRARAGALTVFRETFFEDWGAYIKPPFPISYPRKSQRRNTA